MGDEGIVELTLVQPFEAQVILAKLRASGIEASVSPDAFPYDSISQADGVAIYVSAEDEQTHEPSWTKGRTMAETIAGQGADIGPLRVWVEPDPASRELRAVFRTLR